MSVIILPQTIILTKAERTTLSMVAKGCIFYFLNKLLFILENSQLHLVFRRNTSSESLIHITKFPMHNIRRYLITSEH